MKIVDLTGSRFARLTVLKQDGLDKTGHKMWLCKCDCGNEVSYRGTLITKGEVLSCGCLRKDRGKKSLTKHGLYYHPLYATWVKMMARCYKECDPKYEIYGGRGISVCERWHVKENFFADMGERPAGMTLDRIDVNGNYEPSNCRWATPKTQSRNRTNTIYVDIGGITKTMAEWADIYDVKYPTALARYKRGLRNEDLFNR